MRRAARIDDNHAAVRKAFRALGVAVWDMAAVGKDFPDLLVAWGNVIVLVEVKDGNKPPSRRKRSKGQLEFARTWPGRVYLCETLDDVEDIVAEIRQDARWVNAGRYNEGRV